MGRSLTFKWIITLLLSSLTGVLLIGLFAYRTTVNEFDRLRLEQARLSLMEELTTYYSQQQTWDGLNDWLHQRHKPDNRTDLDEPFDGPRNSSLPLLFSVADLDGMVQLEVGPYELGTQANAQSIDEGYPIEVDNVPVGTLLLALPPPRLDPREQVYVDRTNQALLIGALGASAVALLIGILLSRQFLSPLSELTEAIGAMRQGELEQQVQVRSRDELGELAVTFNEMSAKLHRETQLRKQMTADIAHDLRTPLLVMSGYLEGLRDGTLAPTPERFEVMNREAALLKRLIEDLRILSLADAGELKLVFQDVQPRELLEQMTQSFDPLASEQQVTLRIEVEDALPAVRVDHERMVQVLTNLVSNGLQHTPAGGSIMLKACRVGGMVEIAVQDTGGGIAPDDLTRIFDRFYRADTSRQSEKGASGLGLAIARSIVEAHGGTISAESEVGTGTIVKLMLHPSVHSTSEG